MATKGVFKPSSSKRKKPKFANEQTDLTPKSTGLHITTFNGTMSPKFINHIKKEITKRLEHRPRVTVDYNKLIKTKNEREDSQSNQTENNALKNSKKININDLKRTF